MIVMPADNTKWQVHYWQGKYSGLGHLFSPYTKKLPFDHLPFALDNGAFINWLNGTPFNVEEWISLMERIKATGKKPLWVLCPDVVTDAKATTELFYHYEKFIREFWDNEIKIAFAVQDGHQPEDVPKTADVVFIGGSTEWKWSNAEKFCSRFETHIGRVNSYEKLCYSKSIGAVSCDGTGWFRGDSKQLQGLEKFLFEQSEGKNEIFESVVRKYTKRNQSLKKFQGDFFA